MADEPKKEGGPITALLAVTLLLLATYVGAYFGVSSYDGQSREFKTAWQVKFFWPALKIEDRCRVFSLNVVWYVNGVRWTLDMATERD